MVIRQVAFDPSYLEWLAFAQAEAARQEARQIEALDGEPGDLAYVPGEVPS